MAKKKFIINDNRIILGEVDFHADLLKDHDKTIGGGYWFFDHLSDTMYLYGASSQFGALTKQQIENASSYALEGHKIIYSPELTLQEALQSKDYINHQKPITHANKQPADNTTAPSH